jgi:hypothetical protein
MRVDIIDFRVVGDQVHVSYVLVASPKGQPRACGRGEMVLLAPEVEKPLELVREALRAAIETEFGFAPEEQSPIEEEL